MFKHIRHKWISQGGFRRHKCEHCGCIRSWDAGWKRLMYYHGYIHSTFTAPECKTVFHCDLITK